MIKNFLFEVYLLISDFLVESLKANGNQQKSHSFYNTVSLEKPHSFYEPQLTQHYIHSFIHSFFIHSSIHSFIHSLATFNVKKKKKKKIVTSANLLRQKKKIKKKNLNRLQMFFYMNPNPPMYVLKTWNEHLISFHSLMFCLKLSKEIVFSFSQVGIAIIVVLYVSQFHVLLNCSPCTPSHLRPLSIIITCLTYH